MKKLFVTALMLTALLAVTVGTAFAGSALELLGVSHNGGGISFTFRVNGEFSQSELESGFVQVQGGDDYPLYCSQTAADEVVCHVSKKVAGHDIVVGFGGARFWTDVPEEWVGRSFCYPVYDASSAFPTLPTVSPGFTYWMDVCSEEQPGESHPFVSGSPVYFLGDPPSGWGNLWFFFPNELDPAYPPVFQFITPGYYKG